MAGTASGWKVAIGTTTVATTATEYKADTYVEIGEVESIGEFGDDSPLTSFASLNDARVRKYKSARDAGTMQVVVAFDKGDLGQVAMRAAEKTSFEYNFRITANDKTGPSDSNTVFFFRGPVASVRKNPGAQDNVVRETYNVAINTVIVETTDAV